MQNDLRYPVDKRFYGPPKAVLDTVANIIMLPPTGNRTLVVEPID
jgi:hypothetical protein